MKDNTLVFKVKDKFYLLEIISMNGDDINTILDQLNISMANYTIEKPKLSNPISIDLYDDTDTKIIAVLTHEQEQWENPNRSISSWLIGDIKKNFFTNKN